MNKRAVGAAAEERAAAFLEGRGVKIRQRNYRSRRGEIDIIGWHDGYLVFFEVKYRSTMRSGYPEEAVNAKKQYQICRTSDYYRLTKQIGAEVPIRYDVISVTDEGIRWIKNAFCYCC